MSRRNSGKATRIPSWPAWLLLPVVLLFAGCSRLKHEQHEYVYVAARQVYLHDRVAAVSNRTALVANGQKLEVIERGKRFLKVSTEKKEVGWIEEHAVIDDKLYERFQDLGNKHRQDTAVSTAQLKDDLFLHVLPGREQEHFLLVPENTRVQLLARGTVAKPAQPGMAAPKPKPVAPAAPPGGAPNAQAKPSTAPNAAKLAAANPAPDAPPVIMEDWWLVRDGQGNTGWLLAGRLDVDVPDEVGIYSEGQRMVGAYPIAKVTDTVGASEEKHGKKGKGEESKASSRKPVKNLTKEPEPDANLQPNVPVTKEITEYVTVLTPPHNGLPFDFDQIRVFTWSLNHHRYETAFRLHGIQGYLPVRITSETIGGQQYPVFSFQIANDPNVSIDPDTGAAHPLVPRTLSFRLEGNMVKRTGSDQGPIQLTHASDEPGNVKKPAKAKKKH